MSSRRLQKVFLDVLEDENLLRWRGVEDIFKTKDVCCVIYVPNKW